MPRILYVEDNEDNAAMLTAWLEIEGDLEVIVATTGAQGVELAAREAPDLVLMDLYLPGLDGFEATRLIRASSGSRRIPIIALSAHAMEEDRARALAAGCDEFETKPVVFDRLVAKIRNLLAAGDESARC
jgi:CheY-like chemotaxis protein